MSALLNNSLITLAVLLSGCAAGLFARIKFRQSQRKQKRASVLAAQNETEKADSAIAFKQEHMRKNLVLDYMVKLTQRLYSQLGSHNSVLIKGQKKLKGKGHQAFNKEVKLAGYSGKISFAAYAETRRRFCIGACGIGVIFGIIFSWQFSILLGAVNFVVGYSMPKQTLKRVIKSRALEAELHLSEMLEIVALGLRSGLTFDRSFALYGNYFHNGFAYSCTKAYRSWSLGLMTREEALHELASSYDCEQLSRIVDSIIRSLRFGSALAQTLEEASVQSRAVYRSALEERVAKAPVKMMIPTGTLILPAMLLLVLGPILLELAGGFS